MGTEALILIPGSPALNMVLWLVIAVTIMYLARNHAHQAIMSIARLLHRGCRIASRGLRAAEHQLKDRNQQVLLQHGREATERHIEREFERVATIVKRDLADFPALQRKLKELLTRVEEDYKKTTEVPPSPPEWLSAIESISQIRATNDPTVARILEDIHNTMKKASDKALSEYRSTTKQRHGILKQLQPYWRKMEGNVESSDKKFNSLDERAKKIDSQIDMYEQIQRKTDQAQKTLSSSSLTQFFISGLVLVIAAMGGFINFQLIALPMSEMVGAGNYIGNSNWQVSDVGALIIICIEITMGLFLMEAIGITKLFPVISHMDDRLRRRIAWTLFSFLLIFASIEAALAYMRDLMAADKEALTQSLAGIQVVASEFRWIPSVGQMAMGFILPFALTFVAIPLESFIHASRTVLGIVAVGLMRFLSTVCRILGTVFLSTGRFVTNLYDVIIIIPLRGGELIHAMRSGDKGSRAARHH